MIRIDDDDGQIAICKTLGDNLAAKAKEQKSDNKGRAYAQLTQNISGYDIASKCIADVVFKLQNTPVKSFASIAGSKGNVGLVGSAHH